MPCLFCAINSDSNIDHICGECFQILYNATQEDLKKSHIKALDLGFDNKALALESFIILEKEKSIEQERANTGKLPNGKGSAKLFGNKERNASLLEKTSKIPKRKVYKKPKTVSG